MANAQTGKIVLKKKSKPFRENICGQNSYATVFKQFHTKMPITNDDKNGNIALGVQSKLMANY